MSVVGYCTVGISRPLRRANRSRGTVGEMSTPAGASPILRVERRERALFVTLDRPEAANALSRALVAELTKLCGDLAREIAAGADLRVLVLTGAGDKAFSAGADLKERRTWTLDDTRVFLGEINALMDALAAFPRPTIAAVNGVAFGGGLELALACDLRIAADTAEMGLTEVRLGIIPGAGGTQRLARIAGVAAAKELILTGRRIGAARARELGIVVGGGAVGGAAGGRRRAGRRRSRRRRRWRSARRSARSTKESRGRSPTGSRSSGTATKRSWSPTIATRGWRRSSKSARASTKENRRCHAATNSRRSAPRSRRAARPSTTRPTPPPASSSAASGSRSSVTTVAKDFVEDGLFANATAGRSPRRRRGHRHRPRARAAGGDHGQRLDGEGRLLGGAHRREDHPPAGDRRAAAAAALLSGRFGRRAHHRSDRHVPGAPPRGAHLPQPGAALGRGAADLPAVRPVGGRRRLHSRRSATWCSWSRRTPRCTSARRAWRRW